jgi:hypothetical protein
MGQKIGHEGDVKLERAGVDKDRGEKEEKEDVAPPPRYTE